ncbi:MAG: HIT family protein [Acidobacteria bacterium]|nr:HIT family protein [Acidobacteriota bacterium]
MTTTPKESCVFCEIVAGRAPARTVFEDDRSLALLDINPLAKGHCLVISKRHEPWWHDLSAEETASLFDVARIVSQKLMRVFHPDFVCMYARGRRVPHTHIFLIPSFEGDPLDRFFNALEGFQESPPDLVRLRAENEMDEAARLLRGA